MLKMLLSVVFVMHSVVLTVIVLMQEGKSAGLSGSVSGHGRYLLGRTRAVLWRASWRIYRSLRPICLLLLAVVLNLLG